MAEVIWSKKANRKRIAFLTYGEKEFGRKTPAASPAPKPTT